MPAPVSQPGFGPVPWERWCARTSQPPTPAPPPTPPPCDFYAVVPPLPYSDYLKRENLQLAPPPRPALSPPPTQPVWGQAPSATVSAFDPAKKARHGLSGGSPVEAPRWKAQLEYVYVRRVVNHLGRLVDVLF